MLIIPRLINEKLFIKDKFHYNKVNSHNRGKRHIMNLVLAEPMDMEMVRLPVYNKAHVACEIKRIPYDKALITGTDVAALRLFDVPSLKSDILKEKDYYLKQ